MTKAAATNLKRKSYEKELEKLQVELCYLQDWVKATGERIIVILEGRDAAGKGGTIKAITERVSPRVFRIVALPAPSDREKSQAYIQRYVERFPARGEIVIFDRSWYNRAGSSTSWDFARRAAPSAFSSSVRLSRNFIVDGGIRLIKIWLEVGQEEQEKRFQARIDDPFRQWKLSPMDVEILRAAGTTTPRRAISCWSGPTASMRRGTSSIPTTRSVRASTSSPTSSRGFPTSDRAGEGEAAGPLGRQEVRRPRHPERAALRRAEVLTAIDD